MKKIVKISLVLAVAMLISVMAVATVSATSDIKNEKTNTGITIDSKEKKIASYKITWNANGGKIGSKKTKVTTIKKGSKINKLAVSPKRSGFSFKGWFNKKSGGKKISKTTKPTKSITLFAQWTKKSTSTGSKLVGHWQRESLYGPLDTAGYRSLHTRWRDYYFYANGRFEYYYTPGSGAVEKVTGKYSVSNGKVHFKQRKFYKWGHDISQTEKSNLIIKYGVNYPKHNYKLMDSWPDMTSECKLGSDKEGNYLLIGNQASGNFASPERYTDKLKWQKQGKK